MTLYIRDPAMGTVDEKHAFLKVMAQVHALAEES